MWMPTLFVCLFSSWVHDSNHEDNVICLEDLLASFSWKFTELHFHTTYWEIDKSLQVVIQFRTNQTKDSDFWTELWQTAQLWRSLCEKCVHPKYPNWLLISFNWLLLNSKSLQLNQLSYRTIQKKKNIFAVLLFNTGLLLFLYASTQDNNNGANAVDYFLSADAFWASETRAGLSHSHSNDSHTQWVSVGRHLVPSVILVGNILGVFFAAVRF